MPTLVEQLGNPTQRPAVIKDCVELIDAQVKQKGFIIKGAYSTIKTIKKGFISETVDALLDDWLTQLQPHYEKWEATKPSSLKDFMIARGDDIAEDLLKVTDKRAEKTSHTTAKKMYGKMRDGAKRNVVEAIPDLANMLDKHIAK
jgi:uncharacterized protein DUF6918